MENETISSTITRKALLEGRVQRANAYLDHFFIITGELTKGSEKCRELGFSTLKLVVEETEKIVPKDGVYAIGVESEGRRLRGMLNVKTKDENAKPDIQVHVFDYYSEFILENKYATITFHKRMRDELNIDNSKKLKDQLEIDKKEIEELIY